ncbi:MAG: ATP-dependent helicase HrpB [Prevotella sp.]
MLIPDGARALPAYAIAGSLNKELAMASAVIVTAPPGAGKSTLLPLTMLEWLDSESPSGRIIMLEPRRIAARSIAERMAELIGEETGHTVGYRMRMESRTSAATRIEVVTEGILCRMIISDPTLDGVSAVIFDEFHERSIYTDEALAMLLTTQRVLRPELRLVIMSATIDTEPLSKALGCEALSCDGLSFPVTIERADDDRITETSPARDIALATASVVRRAMSEHDGDILVFLPGQAEILQCQALLSSLPSPTSVIPLYGSLPIESQRRATAPGDGRTRRIILSTPIAETSLTIEGVSIVIDSGLCRAVAYDARSGLSRLQTSRISLDMATQRAGRAGRLGPGVCYRMYSTATETRMQPCRTPEIQNADLAPLLLDIASWGGERLSDMPWLTPPPQQSVERARDLLLSMRAIDSSGAVTGHGQRMSSLPCHPRIAAMLLASKTSHEADLAADIAAILEDKDPLDPMAAENDADIQTRLQMLHTAQRGALWQRLRTSARQYRQLLSAISPHTPRRQSHQLPHHTDTAWTAGRLLAAAYPERVAISTDTTSARGNTASPQLMRRYRLASGATALLPDTDALTVHKYIAVATMTMRGDEGRIHMAAPLDTEDVKDSTIEYDNIYWDNKAGVLVMQRERRLGHIVMSSRPLTGIPQTVVHDTLATAVRSYGESMLSLAADEVRQLQQRIAVVSDWHPELCLPPCDTAAILSSAEEWGPMFFGDRTTAAELHKIDMREVVWSRLTYEQRREVERLAPAHITLPSGREKKIEYRQGAAAPVVKARIQECFGMRETPRIDGGRRPLLMELLSPGFKPVQLTQDLGSFWQTTYYEVRKELRRRYPKHDWPDNP